MDVLTDVLAAVRLESAVYYQSELALAEWGLSFLAIQHAVFHIVKDGLCWLSVESGGEPLCLRAGDLLVLPHGTHHYVTSQPNLQTMFTIDLMDYVGKESYCAHYGDEPTATTLICGMFHVGARDVVPLLELLPPILHFRSGESAHAHLAPILHALMSEARSQQPGNQVILTRLADVLFVQVLRGWLADSANAAAGWLGALCDPHIAHALSEIHRSPAHDWDVETLARSAAMSRSAFAASFRALVGEPPMAYLRRWRMTLARNLLEREDSTLLAIADQLGYGSEAAFNKAFKQEVGIAPGAYRRGRATRLPSLNRN